MTELTFIMQGVRIVQSIIDTVLHPRSQHSDPQRVLLVVPDRQVVQTDLQPGGHHSCIRVTECDIWVVIYYQISAILV